MPAQISGEVMVSPASAQCAMCRTALESAEGAQLASALRVAVAFLLPVPFVAIGAVVLIIRRRQDDAGRLGE